MNVYIASLVAIRFGDDTEVDHLPSFYHCETLDEAKSLATEANFEAHPHEENWELHSEYVIETNLFGV